MPDENPPRKKPTLSVYDGKTGVETVWLPTAFPSGTFEVKRERALTICGDIEPEDVDVIVFNGRRFKLMPDVVVVGGRRFKLIPCDDRGDRHDPL